MHITVKRNILKILILLCLSAAAVLYCIRQNSDIEITNIELGSTKLPDTFDGFRIVQISDVHDACFGKNQSRLLALLRETYPDIIVITGDLVNHDTRRYDNIETLARGACEICPVYFAAGNHEISSGRLDELSELLTACGVTVLDDSAATITRGGEYINIIGMTDVSVNYENFSRGKSEAIFAAKLTKLCCSDNSFKIVLSHRPDLVSIYQGSSADIVFSGHAHGGQFRLPFIGGLYAPNQGIFPEYTSGLYSIGQTSLVVNRGLGPSVLPIRINNKPEITAVTLRCAQEEN